MSLPLSTLLALVKRVDVSCLPRESRRATDETTDATCLANHHACEVLGALLLRAADTLLVVWDGVVTTFLGDQP